MQKLRNRRNKVSMFNLPAHHFIFTNPSFEPKFKGFCKNYSTVGQDIILDYMYEFF